MDAPNHAKPVSSRARASVSELLGFYRRLSAPGRVGVWGLLAVEAVVIVLAERDIQHRSSQDIRGPKLLWRILAAQNIVGPAAYFGIGRRSSR